MRIHFSKYQGAGNDFVMIDNREKHFPTNTSLVHRLCDRRFGIGADGLILLQNHAEYDFEMVYFNADGNIGSMCGNGGRCVAAFAKAIGIAGDSYHFIAADGPHRANFKGNIVSLQMRDVDKISQDGSATVIDTGSPHYIAFQEQIDELDIVRLAKEIRYNDTYKSKGINVNFLVIDKAVPFHISLRTYERGVEDETLACGTGVVASALAYHHNQMDETPLKNQKIKVSARGGELEVAFDYDPKTVYSNVWLTGPAEWVFDGTVETNS